MTREELETLARETISAELYYELCNNIDVTTDEELQALIACNGDYELELKANT